MVGTRRVGVEANREGNLEGDGFRFGFPERVRGYLTAVPAM
jgi:hypothetical protein